MKKKSYKNLFICWLIIAAMFVDTTTVFAAKPKIKESKKGAKKEAVAEVKKVVEKKERTEIKYTGVEAKRNPFAPPKVVAKMLQSSDKIEGFAKIEEVKMPKIEVQGIIWSKAMPQVIINGEVMKAGDYIQEFQIKEVTKKGIILFHKGKEYLMQMQSSKQNPQKKKKIRSKK